MLLSGLLKVSLNNLVLLSTQSTNNFQGLARLIVMAAKEDKYGRIHGSKLSPLLSNYLRLHSLLRAYLSTPSLCLPSSSSTSGYSDLLDPAKSLPILSPLLLYIKKQTVKDGSETKVLEQYAQVIEACIYMIVGEWYEEIGRMVVDQDIAPLLQKFLDFQV